MLRRHMDIQHVIAFEVDHCPQSFGCLFYSEKEFGPGNKIVYSGDTKPCQNLINYAKKCSLLIHEATF
jgi:ribonuclease Z